jgi:hypothetical protein
MKMKIVVFLSVVITCITISSQAQSGARLQVGLNLANVSVANNGTVNKANMLTSFQVGITGDLHVGSILYFQPALLVTGKGSKTESGSQNSSFYSKATTNPLYVEIPANFALKFPVSKDIKLYAGAGPYLAVGIAGKTKIDKQAGPVASHNEQSIKFSNDDPTTLDYDEGAGFGIMRRFDYGLNGTAGIEGKTIAIGVNYGLGLAKLQSGTNSSADNINKHRVLSIVLGFKL